MLEIIIKENGKEIVHAENAIMYMASIQYADGETGQFLHKDMTEFEKLDMDDAVASFMALLTGVYRLMDAVFEKAPLVKGLFQEWVESDVYKRTNIRSAENE